MLIDVVKYSGVYAKTCAMRSSLLTYEDFDRLSQCEDVKQFSDLLAEKETYKDSIEEAESNGLTRVAVEGSLLKSLHSDYQSLFSFMTGADDRKYLDVFFMQYEIELIKRILRRLYDKKDIHNLIPKYDTFLTRHTDFSIDALESSTTIEEAIENLSGSEFYDALTSINKENITLFDYEMQLDFHGYLKKKKYLDKYLKGSAKKSQARLNGIDADLHNIMWIYRAKTFYEIDKDWIFTYIIPLNYKLDKTIIKSLIDAEGSDGFKEILSKTYYKDVFSDFSTNSMERDFYNYMIRQYYSESRKNACSPVCVLCHIYLKALEIRNLTTLIECVRYKLPPKTAMSKIYIGALKAGDKLD